MKQPLADIIARLETLSDRTGGHAEYIRPAPSEESRWQGTYRLGYGDASGHTLQPLLTFIESLQHAGLLQGTVTTDGIMHRLGEGASYRIADNLILSQNYGRFELEFTPHHDDAHTIERLNAAISDAVQQNEEKYRKKAQETEEQDRAKRNKIAESLARDQEAVPSEDDVRIVKAYVLSRIQEHYPNRKINVTYEEKRPIPKDTAEFDIKPEFTFAFKLKPEEGYESVNALKNEILPGVFDGVVPWRHPYGASSAPLDYQPAVSGDGEYGKVKIFITGDPAGLVADIRRNDPEHFPDIVPGEKSFLDQLRSGLVWERRK